MRHYLFGFMIAVAVAADLSFSSAVFGQEPVQRPAAAEREARQSERRQVLESDRWRQTQREFEEWLSIQQIYRPEEISAILQQMRERVSRMSPQELERFLDEMDARMRVLKSPEAEDSRQWLKQFLAVAKNPEQQLGRSRPDVLNMSAAQIRQEIAWLEQHRASRQQAQSAFNQTRAAQGQIARDVQSARRDARQPVDRSNWPSNAPRTFSPYAPRRDVIRTSPDPTFMIGPWGAPYIVW